MVDNIRLEILPKDDIIARFGNQLAALGEGKARQAMARTVNHEGKKARTKVIRALVRQTSAPRRLVVAALSTRQAFPGAKSGPIEFAIVGTGSELPLKWFGPKQFSFGTRAKVWGKSQRFEGSFMNAGRWNSGNQIGGGHVFHRTGGFNAKSGRNNAFQRMFGPSIPKEMLLAETKAAFMSTTSGLADRLGHEIGRLLPG